MKVWFPSSRRPRLVELLAARDPVEDYILAHYRACTSLTSPSWRFLFYEIRKGLGVPKRVVTGKRVTSDAKRSAE